MCLNDCSKFVPWNVFKTSLRSRFLFEVLESRLVESVKYGICNVWQASRIWDFVVVRSGRRYVVDFCWERTCILRNPSNEHPRSTLRNVVSMRSLRLCQVRRNTLSVGCFVLLVMASLKQAYLRFLRAFSSVFTVSGFSKRCVSNHWKKEAKKADSSSLSGLILWLQWRKCKFWSGKFWLFRRRAVRQVSVILSAPVETAIKSWCSEVRCAWKIGKTSEILRWGRSAFCTFIMVLRWFIGVYDRYFLEKWKRFLKKKKVDNLLS